MTLKSRLILSLALIAGIAPAFAQSPAPIPALPDAERRTAYSISASTCACAVGFQLYGDGTDYQSWVEVSINGVPVNGWTITSPSGSLASLPRPITNAVLTFNQPQTGTVQIIGARRPRRTSQFSENAGVAARDINQALSDIVAQNRETWDKINDVSGRVVLARPGETLALLPVLASRVNTGTCFDNSGNLTTCVSVPNSTFSAGTGILFTGTNPTTISLVTGSSAVSGASTTFTSAQNGAVVNRSNSGLAMADTLPGTVPGVLPAGTVVTIANVDTTGIESVKVGAGAAFRTASASTGSIYICPGQAVRVFSDGSNYWVLDRPGRCRFSANTSIFVSSGAGSNSNDGLTSGTALADPTFAYALLQNFFDLNGKVVTFNVANGTYGQITLQGPLFGAIANRLTTNVQFLGNAGSPSSVIVTAAATYGAIQAFNGAIATFDGFQVINTVSSGIFAHQGSMLQFKDIDFHGVGVGLNHVVSQNGSLVSITGNYTISSSAGCHWIAGSMGQVETLSTSPTITLTGTPAFSSAFACAQYPSVVVIQAGATFSGAATGPRYLAFLNGVINTAGGGANFFPGNSAGVLQTGGQYQ